ncbi:MAG TPA: sulfate adenylyltransferase subunit CysN [Terriglobales bacterium]|nr:sulfate adenylyltransferase subunit CysN [Terriglobales bacterium]
MNLAFAPSEAHSELLRQNLRAELLRFTTAGSVDDGKSTLIGRLLHDSKSVYEDQLASVKKSRINRSSGPIDFSLLTDGLRAEREQGITIDVAYRYFATARRKFIIADTPGHEQYTRNMATGASTADLAIILIDASKGLLPQTHRHAYIASLLGIPNLLAAVNKMDLVDFSEARFLELEQAFGELAAQLGTANVQAIPISALDGDNVVDRSERTQWYGGPTLLEHLETVPIRRVVTTGALRFPIQYVIRPDANFRGFAGQIAAGTLRPGDEVMALPSKQSTRVKAIIGHDGDLAEAYPPMSVTVTLEDEIDLSRGDMLVNPSKSPEISTRLEAMLVWMHAQPLQLSQRFLLKHTGKTVRAQALRIVHRVNVSNLQKEPARQLQMNDIAAVELQTTAPLFFDAYESNRITGSFILIDPISNATVAAGMIRRPVAENATYGSPVTLAEREMRNGHRPAVILVNDAKLAKMVERNLFDDGFQVLALEAEAVSRDHLPKLIGMTTEAGVVTILSGVTADAKKLLVKHTEDSSSFFDLSSINSTDDNEVLQRVASLARSLRNLGDANDI